MNARTMLDYECKKLRLEESEQGGCGAEDILQQLCRGLQLGQNVQCLPLLSTIVLLI